MKTAVTLIIVLIVIAAGYFLFFAKKTEAPVTNPQTTTGTSTPIENTNTQATTSATAPAATAKTVTVTYNGSAFSPASVSIKKGDSVKFVDASGQGFWVASNPHPVHTGYSGTSVSQHCPDTAGTAFDECAVGASYTFTFEKVGSWGYHNHLNHSAGGTVVVSQ
jgi:plastocyanin